MFGFFRQRKHAALSPEVQLLWAEIQKFRIRFRGRGASVEKAIDVVSQKILRQLTHEVTFATELILRNGWPVSDAANMLVAEYVSAEILTGQMHSSPGILDDKGKAYLHLFKVCSERLISSGRLPAPQAQSEIRAFEDEIASIG